MKKWIALLLSVALAWGTLPLALAEDVEIVVEEAEASVEEAGSRALFEEAAPEEALTLSGEAPEPADADALGQSAAPLANASDDFEINEGGWLVKYKGPGGDVVIPDGVTRIWHDVFLYCNSLTSVKIPNSVTIIDYYAFFGCSNLTSVMIPNSVTSIGFAAFNGCSSLTSVTIPNSVTSISSGVFAHCSSLTSVTIPNSVTSIEKSTFYDCSSLTSVTIPSSVTSIGAYAFYGCSSLTSVTIPKSLTNIGAYAFYGCSSLTSMTIPDSVTSIEDHAFQYCSSLTSVTIPNSVTSIGAYAFDDCSNLTSVAIPDSVTSIADWAFYNCNSLTSVTIPDSVTSIGACAFLRCHSLASVTIPGSVTSIGSNAFRYCPNLTIYGEEGSYAQTYAKGYNIPFVVGTFTPTPPAQPTLTSTALTLGVGETFKLIASDSPVAASQCKFKSKDKKIAKVSSKGVVTGVTKGKSTTITVTPPSGEAIKVKVSVKKAPTKVTVKPKAVEMDVGRTASLMAKLPSGSASAIQWKSSKKKVATVDANGIVTAVGAGTATITATAFNGKKDTCEVTVWKIPTKISLDKTKASIKVNETYQLSVKFPKGANAPVTWVSTNAKAALVDQNGLVTGVGKGTTTIRAVVSDTVQASCKITVKKNSGVKYRALLIGQTGFEDIGKSCENDVKSMSKLLKKVYGPTGSRYSITVHNDINRKTVLKDIKSTFAGADDDDVSLFFISTHGDASSSGKKAGRLSMRPSGTLLLSDLANALAAVPGKVIVLIDACGSGAAIYDPGVAENGLAANRKASAAFDAAAVNAFAEADPGLWVDAQGNGVSEAEVFSNTGEFRMESKFCVLTAARYQEMSASGKIDGVVTGFFTYVLTGGVGTSGKILADSDGNRVVTLDELFRFISQMLDKKALEYEGKTYYQHVQVYPKDSNYPLFRR